MLRPFLALLLIPALATAALARPDDPPKKPNPKGNDGFRFSPPDGAPGTPPTPKAPDKATPPPVDPVAAQISLLARWPGVEGKRAAEWLVLRGSEAVFPVLESLDKGDPAVRPGAAWVLGRIGGREHVQAILRAAAERAQASRVDVFFEAARTLDEALTKQWLFSWLQALDRPVFRASATEFLATLVTLEDRPKIDGFLRSKMPAVRTAGLELLVQTKAPDASDRLVDALPDPTPDVARRAATLLSFQDDPAVRARLNVLARQGDSRQRAYATLALVEVARAQRLNPFEVPTLVELIGRRGLAHPDVLNRAAAAAGLAFGALDLDDASMAPLLDGPVVEELILSVAGDHFLDYNSVVEPVFASLRRLTGLDLPSTAKAWGQWWTEQKGRFHARRLLKEVSDADAVHARVTADLVDAEGRRRRVAFAPKGGDRGEGALLLPLPAFKALLRGLEDAGVFTTPDDGRTLADEHLAVRLAVANQERRLLLVPGTQDGRYATLRARVEALEETNLWQLYRDTDRYADPEAWAASQSTFFATAEPQARRAALVRMIATSFDDLATDAERSEALDRLDQWNADLGDDEAVALLAWALSRPAMADLEARVVEKVASLGRPSLASALVEGLSTSASPTAERLLAKALADAGTARVKEAFADPRRNVRAASAAAALRLVSSTPVDDAAAKRRLEDAFLGGLKALLVDPDLGVRVRSATALAIWGEPGMLTRLGDVFREGDTSVRIAVAEGLGRIGGQAVRPLLVQIVGETAPGSAPVRSAALEAMAKIGDADAVRILAFYMLGDPDDGVRQAAEAALVTVRTDDAKVALVDLLGPGKSDGKDRARIVRALSTYDGDLVREALGRALSDPDPSVVDQAALGLARQNDAASFPYLVAILRRAEEALRPKALEALSDLTCVALVVTSYESAADQYETWGHAHRGAGERAWFRDALKRHGYDVSGLEGYVRGEVDLKAVPTLLRALRDDDPSVRRGSDVALRRLSSRSFATLDRGTPRDQAAAIADEWARWWASRPESKSR